MFTIKARMSGGNTQTEEIDTFETRKEAIEALLEYRVAFGQSYALWLVDAKGDRVWETISVVK